MEISKSNARQKKRILQKKPAYAYSHQIGFLEPKFPSLWSLGDLLKISKPRWIVIQSYWKCINFISIPQKFGGYTEDFETSTENYLIILEMCNLREI